jgi:hypothetical protein
VGRLLGHTQPQTTQRYATRTLRTILCARRQTNSALLSTRFDAICPTADIDDVMSAYAAIRSASPL